MVTTLPSSPSWRQGAWVSSLALTAPLASPSGNQFPTSPSKPNSINRGAYEDVRYSMHSKYYLILTLDDCFTS
jgi:hypothetical protein